MDAGQMRQLVRCDPLFMGRLFRGVHTADKLPDVQNLTKDSAYIINTNNHWIFTCFEPVSQTAYFFDSFAKSPEYWGTEIASWISDTGFNLICNQDVLQRDQSPFCGLFVIFCFYMFARGESLEGISRRFSSDLQENDKMVCTFSWKQFGFKLL